MTYHVFVSLSRMVRTTIFQQEFDYGVLIKGTVLSKVGSRIVPGSEDQSGHTKRLNLQNNEDSIEIKHKKFSLAISDPGHL